MLVDAVNIRGKWIMKEWITNFHKTPFQKYLVLKLRVSETFLRIYVFLVAFCFTTHSFFSSGTFSNNSYYLYLWIHVFCVYVHLYACVRVCVFHICMYLYPSSFSVFKNVNFLGNAVFLFPSFFIPLSLRRLNTHLLTLWFCKLTICSFRLSCDPANENSVILILHPPFWVSNDIYIHPNLYPSSITWFL